MSAEAADLQRFLVAAGFTRQQIAERLGVSRRALYGWVSGTLRPTPEHLVALRALAQEQPVHAAASRAAAAGRLQCWPRSRTVRSPETWEQDTVGRQDVIWV
jgi:transcriptional regulator with XRE-family HTH domain